MRTKSFLVAAAVIAAGALTSQAQSNVYSLNVVGYVNLTLKPGYNLISAQLATSSTAAAINAVLTNAPALADGSTMFSWNSVAQDFTQPSIFVNSEQIWYNADGTALSTATAPRGTSFFIKNEGADATLTLVGEVPQGANSASIPNNYSFLADFVPASQEIATNGFPIADGSSLATFNATAQDYSQPLLGAGGEWYNSDGTAVVKFAPAVGQGFLYHTDLGAATWNRNFTVK